jgi:hypothetical protein
VTGPGPSFVFVVQAGELERQGALLAASLRAAWGGEAELVAAVPQCRGPLLPPTVRLLDALGVRREPVTNPLDRGYPIGHKLAAFGLQTRGPRRIFLDSDTLCGGRDSTWDQHPAAFLARPVDGLRWARRSEIAWRLIFATCGARMPDDRVRTTLDGRLLPPHWNAGTISVAAEVADELAESWTDCAHRLDRAPWIRGKRPWLDQLALSAAVARLGLSWDLLPRDWNDPTHLRPLSEGPLPRLIHHHGPATLLAEPALRDRVGELCRTHADLASVLRRDPSWEPLVVDRAGPTAESGSDRPVPGPRVVSRAHEPTVLVTGIPRSGTSWLLRLLARRARVVTVNEPDEAISSFLPGALPGALGRYVRESRARVLALRPLAGKVDAEGLPAEDTATPGMRMARKVWDVEGEDFVLVAKNTLAWLSHAEDLLREVPHARLVLCVRDPVETLASWAGLWSHLRRGAPWTLRVGGPRDPAWQDDERAALLALRWVPDAAVRRARWWTILAERVLRLAPQATLVRYHELAADPEGVVGKVLHGLSAGALRPGAELAKPRPSRRRALPEGEVRLIRSICGEVAGRLAVVPCAAHQPPAGTGSTPSM